MQAPAFWDAPAGVRARLLAPLGALCGAVAARRMDRRGLTVGRPVICVGNFTAGGAGKTPVVAALGAMLADDGHRPFVVSRGYGGALRGPVRVDPAVHDADAVGDEPLLLAGSLPVVVARDRAAGARMAVAAGASVVLLDDGFQNGSLAKDLSIVVVDGASGIGNRRCLPAGPLRAPMARQWPHVGALVVLGPGQRGATFLRHAAARGIPAFLAGLAPDPQVSDDLRGRRVLAFAGIGRPEKFDRTLRQIGADVAEFHAFPDHYPYAARDLDRLAADARASRFAPVTTEKDAMRIGAPAIARHFSDGLVVVKVTAVFQNPTAIRALASRAAREGASL